MVAGLRRRSIPAPSIARSTIISCRWCSNQPGATKSGAAQLLGITRRTLRLKLRELGLSVTKTVEAAEGDEFDSVALGPAVFLLEDRSRPAIGLQGAWSIVDHAGQGATRIRSRRRPRIAAAGNALADFTASPPEAPPSVPQSFGPTHPSQPFARTRLCGGNLSQGTGNSLRPRSRRSDGNHGPTSGSPGTAGCIARSRTLPTQVARDRANANRRARDRRPDRPSVNLAC